MASEPNCNYYASGQCGHGSVSDSECKGKTCGVAEFGQIDYAASKYNIPPKVCPECVTDPEEVEGWIHTNPAITISETFGDLSGSYVRVSDNHTDLAGDFGDFAQCPPLPEPESLSFTPALDIQIGGSHYKHYKIQPIEFFMANQIPYDVAAVIKYVMRHAKKNGVEDLDKAIHLINLMKEHYYGPTRNM